jgi:hypothetical protein
MAHISSLYDSAYQAIADDHLYLNLTDGLVPKADDLPYSNLYAKGLSDEYINSYTLDTNDRWNPSRFSAVKRMIDSCSSVEKMTKSRPIGDTDSDNFMFIKQLPVLSDCKQLIEQHNYSDMVNQPHTTFLAFENGELSKSIQSIRSKFHIREILKYHTLPFELRPGQLVNKKIRMNTLSNGNVIFFDGRGSELNIYIKPSTLLYGTYPEEYERIKVKSWIKTDNGWLYILERPLFPDIVI